MLSDHCRSNDVVFYVVNFENRVIKFINKLNVKRCLAKKVRISQAMLMTEASGSFERK